MGALDVEEMELSSKIDLRDVSWWMSIKDACRLEMSIILKRRMHLFSYKKKALFNLINILLQNGSIKNTKLRT
jgi:hypothetical protein